MNSYVIPTAITKELGLDQVLFDKFIVCDGGIYRKHPKAPVTGGYMSFHFQYNGAVLRMLKFENEATSSNDSEYKALAHAIRTMAYHQEYNKILAGTQVFMDSMLVVKQVNGVWRVNADHLIPHVTQCKRLIKHHSMNLRWIPKKIVFQVLGH